MSKININGKDFTVEELNQLIESSKKQTPKTYKGKYLVAPEDGTEYWFVYSDGGIDKAPWADDWSDTGMLASGNCYATEEAAQLEADNRKTRFELEKFAEENNEGEIDWEDVNQKKHSIGYDQVDKHPYVSGCYFCQSSTLPYFTSEEIAKKAIDTIGEERIKKLFS